MINIRKETPEDYSAIYSLVKMAFKSADHSDRDEHNLVSRLRNGISYIPQLSLVAEDDGEIVGFIMFTKLTIGSTTQLALAPVAVHPNHQGKGIGGALIKNGHYLALEMGYEFSVVLGHQEYYPRYGYIQANNFGIHPPFEITPENFMAINLMGKDTNLNAIVEYAKEFFD